MRRISLALVILLAPPVGYAQTEFHKCVQGNEIVYQNEPCPATHRTDKVVSYPPTHDSETATRQRQHAQAEIDRRNAAARQPVWVPPRGTDAKDCQNARARRDRTVQQIGSQRLTRTHRIELCRMVAASCGGAC